MALTLCLTFDLNMIMKYPFANKDKLMNNYILFSVGLATLVSISITLNVSNTFIPLLSFMVLYFVVIFAGILSLVGGLKSFFRSGISRSIRLLVLKRHFLSIIVFVFCNIYLV